MTELGDALRDALQGKSRADAMGALFTALRSYIAEHPGRYNATTGAQFQGSDDPLLAATVRPSHVIGHVAHPGRVSHGGATKLLDQHRHGTRGYQVPLREAFYQGERRGCP